GESAQMVFVDTPGLLEPRYLLQESMLQAARAAVSDSDIVLLLLDATQPTESLPDASATRLLARRGETLIVTVNKIDVAEEGAIDALRAATLEQFRVAPFEVSAARGDGVEALRETLATSLPESPLLYPEDELAVQPVRFFVAELVRETVFEEYAQEIPYSTAVVIEEFRESSEPLYIRAHVILERESQKAIVIGKGGAGIKRLGRRSREKIEAFLDRRIYLDLWVKTRAGWRKKPAALREYGYDPPKSR
ncbi:MAG: GTPase Era, partial [Longimicrobiales bacterium]